MTPLWAECCLEIVSCMAVAGGPAQQELSTTVWAVEETVIDVLALGLYFNTLSCVAEPPAAHLSLTSALIMISSTSHICSSTHLRVLQGGVEVLRWQEGRSELRRCGGAFTWRLIGGCPPSCSVKGHRSSLQTNIIVRSPERAP
ncbi:hypothetical protein INR49_007803 [Caranx melampygus]|nr:hypothetical protein INR49_007803 [Caranx melampygus]